MQELTQTAPVAQEDTRTVMSQADANLEDMDRLASFVVDPELFTLNSSPSYLLFLEND
jgi:hypothetical protein